MGPKYYFFSYVHKSLGSSDWQFEEAVVEDIHPFDQLLEWRQGYRSSTYRMISWLEISEDEYHRWEGWVG